jgi:hypothetical protein
MEYFIGSLTTVLLAIFVKKYLIKHDLVSFRRLGVIYSQSQIFNIVKPFIPIANSLTPLPNTQSRDYEKKMTVKVIMTEGQAYWIRDNAVYTADIAEDYSVRNETTRIVDIMGMDKVQLDKMIFIVDRLTEGSKNDSGDSGHTWF